MEAEQVHPEEEVLRNSERAIAYMFSQLRPHTVHLLEERGLLTSNPDMEANIGRHVVFINETAPKPIPPKWKREVFRIIGVQKLFDGSDAYRVVTTNPDGHDGVGKPGRPEEIEFVEGGEVIDFSQLESR